MAQRRARERARRGLATMPVADRDIRRLKTRARRHKVPLLRSVRAAGPDARRVLCARAASRSPPGSGLFTREGYLQVFKAKGENLAKELSKEETWVLGRCRRARAASGRGEGLGRRARALRAGLREAVDGAACRYPPRAFERPCGDPRAGEGPFGARLVAAEAPARRGGEGAHARGPADAAKDQGKKELEKKFKDRYGGLLEGQIGAKLPVARPEEAVEVRFAPLRNLVAQRGPAGPAPIDAVMQSMREFYTQLRAARNRCAAARSARRSPLRAPR